MRAFSLHNKTPFAEIFLDDS
jgi:cytoskeleton-associated protein 5